MSGDATMSGGRVLPQPPIRAEVPTSRLLLTLGTTLQHFMTHCVIVCTLNLPDPKTAIVFLGWLAISKLNH